MFSDSLSFKHLSEGSTIKMTKFYYKFNVIIVILLIFGFHGIIVNSAPHGGHQRTIRLCSKSLSDALYLVCRDRGGYAEPFSYSGEEEARAPSGPGLVEECCYRSCSLEQLEQYCKPAPDDKTHNSQDGIEESLRIVNLPYSSTRELVTERRSSNVDATANVNNEKTPKSKNRHKSKLRKLDCSTRKRRKHVRRGMKGTKIINEKKIRIERVRERPIDNYDNHDDDDVVNDDVSVTTRRECRRRRRWRRRRRGKALREKAVAIVPEFKVGTTLPEPKDSLLLFPSRSNLVYKELSKNLAGIEELEVLERFNILDVDDINRDEDQLINHDFNGQQ